LVNRRRRRLELTARLHKRHPKDTIFVIKIAGKRTPVSHYMRGAFARSDAKQRNFTILSNAPVKTGEMELVLRSRLGFEETTLRDLKNALTVIKSRRGLEEVTLQDYKDATFVIKDC